MRLDLTDPAPGPGRTLLAALVAVPILTGLAAAQPVIDRAKERQEHVNAEVMFVFDTTRSMYALRRSAGADPVRPRPAPRERNTRSVALTFGQASRH